MKTLFLVLAVAFSFSSFSEVPYIVVHEMTCEEVNLAVENYGKVKTF